MLEKNLQDILNAGLGLFKMGEENFQSALKAVEKTFEDLKGRGASDNSEAAQKIREVLDNTIKGVKDVQTQAEQNFNRVLAEAEKNYSQVLEQVRGVVGEERINDLNTRLDELATFIKEKAQTVAEQANSFAAQVQGAAADAARSGAGRKKSPPAG